jgi:hypothetical protein
VFAVKSPVASGRRVGVRRAIVLAAAGLAVAALAAPAAAIPSPEGFAARVDNPWLPLRPGTTFVYRGVADGVPARRVVKVTRGAKAILGVACVPVDERLYVDGRLVERTTAWYAQDRRGNVWLLGSSTAAFDVSGQTVGTSGWEAGLDGGRAGLVMPAGPYVGFTRRIAYLRGQVDDRFRVLNLRGRVDSPVVASRDALVTEEWTPLVPDAVVRKAYVRGVGLVEAGSAADDLDRMLLVSLRRPKP